MNILISSIPIFLIILTGFVIGQSRWFNPVASEILTKLIFFIVMPVTLFLEIAILPIKTVLIWPYMGAFFISSILVALLGLSISYCYFKRKKAGLVVNTMASIHTNTAYIALPLFLLLFNTASPVASIIIVQSIFNFIILFMLDTFTYSTEKNKHMTHRAFSVFWKNPILIGILTGVVFSYFHIELPDMLEKTFAIVSQSAPFLALFSLGLSLSFINTALNKKDFFEITTLVFLKSFLHPLVAFLVGHYLFKLTGFWLFAVIFIAAMPSPKNLFIFAKRYQTGEDRASLIVFTTTVISVVTLNMTLLVKSYLP